MPQGFVVLISFYVRLLWLAHNRLGDWGSRVQISALRPIKSSTSEFLCKSAKSPGTGRGQDFRLCYFKHVSTYYNEIDPYAAQWLRNLIAAGHIAAGDVDERSILDVRPHDLRTYRQCHFFAGIGGWSYALRLAGWPDDRPVWTGSCPCQPFSAAGKGKAAEDERHLWPCWFSLIRECRPAIVFGEQVEAAIGWGWLDVVFSDLEAEGYACGASVLPACSVGAPHIRNRVWFVADANGGNASAQGLQRGGEQRQQPQDGGSGIMADDDEGGRAILGAARIHAHGESGDDAAGRGTNGDVADAEVARRGARRTGKAGNGGNAARIEPAGFCDAWADIEWLLCTDGKARPVEPGTFPLAHGVLGRVGRLRAYGNAIVPQVAAEFVLAYSPNKHAW